MTPNQMRKQEKGRVFYLLQLVCALGHMVSVRGRKRERAHTLKGVFDLWKIQEVWHQAQSHKVSILH